MNRRSNAVGAVRGVVHFSLLLAVVFMTTVSGLAQSRTEAARELSRAFSSVAKAAMPAVVSIKVEKTVDAGPMMGFDDPSGQFGDDFLRRFFGDQAPQRRVPEKHTESGQGSGFIISEDGYILTNNHVVGDVDKMAVELQDGRTFANARLIGTDPDSEVALIKIEGNGFPVLQMGDSDKVEIGDWAIAIGNPFGLNETVTVGVISAVARSNVHIAAYENFLQTDAAINPGNSGGPLINLDGKVIGINTAILSESGGYMGIGFAIPINMARSIGEQLRSSGKVSRGFLGLYAQDVTAEVADLLGLKDQAGILIAQIEPGAPADKAGLKVHDVILAIDGRQIRTYTAFRNEIAVFKPGSEIRLDILREGKRTQVPVTLGERPTTVAQAEPQTPQPEETLGLQVMDVTREIADRSGYEVGEGVVVRVVTPGSPTAEAGIQPGDLIKSVNSQNVTSVEEFAAAVRRSQQAGRVLFLVKRGRTSQFLIVRFK